MISMIRSSLSSLSIILYCCIIFAGGFDGLFERSVVTGNRGNNYPNTISQLGVLVEYYLQNTKRQSTDGISFDRPIEGDGCGQQKFQPKLTRRIFGGTTAQPHSWPWQVFISEEGTCDDGSDGCLNLCGGSILNSRFILTAAHCIESSDPSKVTVIAGMHDKESVEENSRRQKIQVKSVFIHPAYSRRPLKMDIALLELVTSLEFNDYVQPVCLPGPDPKPGSSVILIGWGLVDSTDEPSSVLKQVESEVIDNCRRYYARFDQSREICLLQPQTGSAACLGDNGGPALQKHDGRWVVEGVASYGLPGCGVNPKKFPEVYVRVSSYLSWIKSIINQ